MLNVLQFSIFFLSFWGSLIFLCEVSQGGRGGIFFCRVNFEGFLFGILFILEVFNFFCVKLHIWGWIFIKFGGYQLCFDGVQGSLILLL